MTKYQAELYHHGVQGQKWGVRRYQNSDGTLTAAGKRRYASEDAAKKKFDLKQAKKAARKKEKEERRQEKEARKQEKEEQKKQKGKKVAVAVGAVTITALAIHASRKKQVANGESFCKKFFSEAKEGAKEGILSGSKEGSKTLLKTLVNGGTLYVGKRAADKILGADTAGKIFNANNSKKIGSFWTYTERNNSDKGGGDDD